MKNIFRILVITGMIALSQSCTTSQKITFLGTPGTEIYYPNMKLVATIGMDGRAKAKVPRDYYTAFMLSKDAQSNEIIPFALDYKYKYYIGPKIAKVIGIPLFGAGMIGVGAGTAAAINGDEELMSQFFKYGLTAMGIGAGMYGVGNSLDDETQRELSFAYMPRHQINNDLVFTPFIDNGIAKNIDITDAQQTPTKDTTSIEQTNLNNVTTTTVARPRSQKSAKTLNDFGQQLQGTYSGQGQLLLKQEIEENYPNIQVVIAKYDKNHVDVRILEDSGDEFFTSSARYNVKKEKFKFILTMEGISSATIIIDRNGNLTYNHPKVNIEGSIYTLKIKATKNK